MTKPKKKDERYIVWVEGGSGGYEVNRFFDTNDVHRFIQECEAGGNDNDYIVTRGELKVTVDVKIEEA